MQTPEQVYSAFSPLWGDIDDTNSLWAKKPLLAHYTSIQTLESILRSNELWFSNPLYMNDHEELNFGVLEGAAAFRKHSGIRYACKTDARYKILSELYERKFDIFGETEALDTYVFCATEHNPSDSDGLLSMWRGYGSNGNGAAIILNSDAIKQTQNSPMIMDQVLYYSREQRLAWIDQKLHQFAQLLQTSDIPDHLLYLPAHSLFERIKIFALFTKHHGFKEEREWRAVYLRERDLKGTYTNMLHYVIGRNGVEPKLKMKIQPIQGLSRDDLSMESLIDHIILGPAVSSPLALNSVRRMTEQLGMVNLAKKVRASTTPFRSVV